MRNSNVIAEINLLNMKEQHLIAKVHKNVDGDIFVGDCHCGRNHLIFKEENKWIIDYKSDVDENTISSLKEHSIKSILILVTY